MISYQKTRGLVIFAKVSGFMGFLLCVKVTGCNKCFSRKGARGPWAPNQLIIFQGTKMESLRNTAWRSWDPRTWHPLISEAPVWLGHLCYEAARTVESISNLYLDFWSHPYLSKSRSWPLKSRCVFSEVYLIGCAACQVPLVHHGPSKEPRLMPSWKRKTETSLARRGPALWPCYPSRLLWHHTHEAS